MPDPDQPINPTQTPDPGAPGMPVVEEITIPTMNQGQESPPPPTSDVLGDGGTPPPPPDLPPVVPPVITPPPAKKFGGRRVIATILGLLVLGGGLTAGLILVRQQQIFREKARELDCRTEGCGPDEECKNVGGGVYDCVGTQQPPPESPPSGGGGGGGGGSSGFGGNAQTSCTACSGGSIVQCVTVASPPNCDPNFNVCKDNSQCAPGGQTACQQCLGAGNTPAECAAPCNITYPTPAAGGGGTSGCVSPASCVNNYSCPSYVGTDLGTKDCGPAYTCCSPKTTAGCTSPAQCVNNYSCPSYVGTDLGVKDCGPAYTCCSPNSSPGTPPPGVTPPPGTPLPLHGGPPGPGPTLPPGVSAQCLNIQAFDTNWTQITNLSTIKVGDKVRFTVAGSASTGTFDKARFTINGTLRPEVTATRPGTQEFFDEYTIPEGTTSFSINAQLHNTVLGWF